VVGIGRGGGSLVPFGTLAYDAGLEQGDLIRTIDGGRDGRLWNSLVRGRPATRSAVVVHPGAVTRTTSLKLQADPALQISDLGSAMTAEHDRFVKVAGDEGEVNSRRPKAEARPTHDDFHIELPIVRVRRLAEMTSRPLFVRS
jgi:hypothetical protein